MQTPQPAVMHNGSESVTADTEMSDRRGEATYVWELPVRITHWVNVLSIGVLTVTGLYIALPFMGTIGLATDQYMMGSVRFVHFVTAFVFTMSVLFRLYWAFVGNIYARWQQFVPINSTRRRAALRMIGFYTFFRREPPGTIGHNSLAGMTYTVVFLLFIMQIVTGFALYALPFHDGFWPITFGWVIVIFGAQPVRLVHDIIMWLLIAFTIHHVYSAILIDIEEHSGLVSSIITGYKSITARQAAAVRAEDEPGEERRRFVSRLFRRARHNYEQTK